MSDDIVKRLRAELDDANDQIKRMRGLIETAEKSARQAYLLWSDEVERRGTVEAERDAVNTRERELLGLLREAHIKMVENNLWRNLRTRIATALLT